jgi:hypothetical protein
VGVGKVYKEVESKKDKEDCSGEGNEEGNGEGSGEGSGEEENQR